MKSHRFVFLDGLRGIAAMAVVIMHFTQPGNRTPLFASAALAVDLFFGLSGFVIAWSYYQRLANDLSFTSYIKKRLVRLYPMFLLGILVGVIAFLLKFSSGENTYSPHEIIMGTLVNLLYLPYFVSSVPDRIDGIFLVNPPAWSLFFEVVANLAFLFTIRFSKTVLVTLTVLFGFWLVYVGLVIDTGPGWSTVNFVGGFPRVGYSFMVGVLIYKFFDTAKNLPRVNPIAISIVLTILLLLPLSRVAYYYYWIFASLFLLPAIVLFGTRVDIKRPSFVKILSYLGWISYPIYCIHAPMLHIWDSINPSPDHYYRSLIILFPLTLLVTHILAKYIDSPVRVWLSKPKLQNS